MTWVHVDLVGQLVQLPLPMLGPLAVLGLAGATVAATVVIATVGERRR